jgi:hypothetical protein
MRTDFCTQSVKSILENKIKKLRNRADELEILNNEIDHSKLTDHSEIVLMNMLLRKEEL